MALAERVAALAALAALAASIVATYALDSLRAKIPSSITACDGGSALGCTSPSWT